MTASTEPGVYRGLAMDRAAGVLSRLGSRESWPFLAVLAFSCAVLVFAQVQASASRIVSAAVGPWFFPSLAAGALGVCSLIGLASLVVRTSRESDREARQEADESAGPLSAAVFLAAGVLGLYTLAIEQLGFVLATPVFLAAAIWFWGYRRLWPVAICAIGATLVIQFAFSRLFGIPLNAFLP